MELSAKSAIRLTGKQPASGAYRNRHGDVLTCVFDGEDSVNGTAIDYRAWPISESPWTSQRSPDMLEVSDGTRVRTYDFEHWSFSERKR